MTPAIVHLYRHQYLTLLHRLPSPSKFAYTCFSLSSPIAQPSPHQSAAYYGARCFRRAYSIRHLELLKLRRGPQGLVKSYSDHASVNAPSVNTQQDGDSDPPGYLNEEEKSIFTLLKNELQPSALEVSDISGGCGSMYKIHITSDRFKGLTIINQHRLVNEILADRIKDWHGLQLKTALASKP